MKSNKALEYVDNLQAVRAQPMSVIVFHGIIAICYCILAVAYEISQLDREE